MRIRVVVWLSAVMLVLLTNSAYGADDIGFHRINPAIALSPPNAAGDS